MDNLVLRPGSEDFPPLLARARPPVEQLYVLGDASLLQANTLIAIVGSRRCSAYGRQITTRLAQELSAQGVVIVSGLAMGIDGISHQATVDAGGKTIAVLPCGIDTIYPSSHRLLAQKILENGGAIISEYNGVDLPMRHQFIARNRIIAAISHGVLITEAARRSGSLHTAAFALEGGKPVLAVPGNITSTVSGGTNQLIKTGAITVTETNDILEAMGWAQLLPDRQIPRGRNQLEQAIIDLMASGIQDMDSLIVSSGLTPTDFNQTLTMLEISGRVRALGMGQWELL